MSLRALLSFAALTLPRAALVLAILCQAAVAAAAPGLPRGTPEAEGVDSAGVLRFVSALEQRIDAVHSFMLVRHGKVVAEGWWSPYEANDLHVMYSVTKNKLSIDTEHNLRWGETKRPPITGTPVVARR